MEESIRFQHFEVLRREDGSLFELGRGAMGVTYKAFDTNLRCHVALKVISPAYLDSDIARERFLREARAAAAIRHPNVATVFHLGNEDETWFYAMEFVDGETVEQMMQRDGAVPTAMALEIADQVARALGAAQKQGLIHRDIKPSNLMLVREDGGDFTVKVIDFGLAKAVDRDSSVDPATLTTGGFLGTPHFASPEQLDERDLDVRSDIYSLGVTLYYMLAGQTPFSGSMAQVMSQHLHRDPPLERLTSQPPQVLALLERMLEKDAGARHQSPADLRKAIAQCVSTVSVIAQSEQGARRPPVLAEDHDTLMDTAIAPEPLSAATEPAPGITLAGRFELIAEYPASQFGRTFRALNKESGATVAVLILDASVLPTSNAYTRLENEITSLQSVHHPAVIRVDSVEHTENLTFISREWSEGPSLIDVMRSNPPALPEAIQILNSLAGGLDAVQSAKVPCPELLPGWILLAPAPEGGNAQPRFNPINLSHVAPASAGVTLAQNPSKKQAGNDGSTAFAAALARVALALFGGKPGGSSQGEFIPIAGLSGEANELLRTALTGNRDFGSAGEFLRQLSPELASARLITRETSPSRPSAPVRAPRKSSGPLLIVGVIAFAVVAGAAILWFFAVPKLLGMIRSDTIAGDIAALAGAAGTLDSAPSIDTPPSADPTPTAADPTPAPTPTPTPAPTPTPEAVIRENALIEALDRSSSLAENGDYVTALDVLSELQQMHPDDPRVPQAIENVSAKLRSEREVLTAQDLTKLQSSLTGAAQAGSTSAQMLLARSLDEFDKTEAFKFYLLAAGSGDSEAMLEVGNRYASGIGTDRSFEQAFPWFERAARKGEARALFSVGECYYFGTGVKKDLNQAIYFLTQAAGFNDPFAKGLLGNIYRTGEGLEKPNYREAFRLLSEAAADGFYDAKGNLGVMIINGEVIDGVPVDGKPQPAKADKAAAFALFKDGAENGNALCTYFYAMCLQSGIGVEKSPKEAKANYIKAAELGNSIAQDFCRKNKWPYSPPAP